MTVIPPIPVACSRSSRGKWGREWNVCPSASRICSRRGVPSQEPQLGFLGEEVGNSGTDVTGGSLQRGRARLGAERRELDRVAMPNNSLQRGRARLGAESHLVRNPTRSRRRTSTGPRPSGRGEARDRMSQITAGKYFNGAAPDWARRACDLWSQPRRAIVTSTGPRPIGRGEKKESYHLGLRREHFNGAAPDWARRGGHAHSDTARTRGLQRGRARLGAERSPCGPTAA